MRMDSPWHIIRESAREWSKDRCSQMAAATAYYTVFALAPLVILLISVAGLVLDINEARQAVFLQSQSLLGEEGGRAVRGMVEASQASPHTPLAATLGILILLAGASGLMINLQDALNRIWKVEHRHTASAVRLFVLKRILSLGMILTIGFLLIVSLFASAAVPVTLNALPLRGMGLTLALPAMDAVLSLLFITALFALLYKYLPDVRIPWRDVLVGASITASLFTIGKLLLGFYLAQKDFTATYGVAASIIILLLWVNYSSQILFLGAEFIKASAHARGAKILPRDYARFDTSATGKIERKPNKSVRKKTPR